MCANLNCLVKLFSEENTCQGELAIIKRLFANHNEQWPPTIESLLITILKEMCDILNCPACEGISIW